MVQILLKNERRVERTSPVFLGSADFTPRQGANSVYALDSMSPRVSKTAYSRNLNINYQIKLPDVGKWFLICCTMLLCACNPAQYKGPAEDFQTASADLRRAYFLEWEISNQARIRHQDLEDQIAILNAPSGANIAPFISKMAARRQKDIHEHLRPLREKAFSALQGYADILVSLASDESTEAITLEMTGLVGDISKVLETAKDIKSTANPVTKVGQFSGPLQQYVGVLNEIIGLVSKVIRERAIVQTIGKCNNTILELLSVLKTEAIAAQDNAMRETHNAKQAIEMFMDKPAFKSASNDSRASIAQRVAELTAIEKRIERTAIADAFDAVVKAQGALIEKAVVDKPADWAFRIRSFREQVSSTKAAIESIRSEM